MSETTPNLPLSGAPSTSATRIIYTIASPYLSELYLKKLTVLLNTGLGTWVVTGSITKGTSGSPASGTVYAGASKFAALTSAAGTATYVTLTYDDNNTNVADVTDVVST